MAKVHLKVLCHTTHADILGGFVNKLDPAIRFGRNEFHSWLENGGPGLSRCMKPIKNGDIPASYVIVYQSVLVEFEYKNGWKGITSVFVYMVFLFFQLHLRIFPYKCPLSLNRFILHLSWYSCLNLAMGWGAQFFGFLKKTFVLRAGGGIAKRSTNGFVSFWTVANLRSFCETSDFECQRSRALFGKVCQGYRKQ